jgi:GNAT superfamily N-acetyltransferase
MIVRAAKRSDIPAIVALNAEVHDIHLQLFPDIFKPTEPAAMAERYSEWLSVDGQAILVVEDDGVVLAYLTLRKQERPGHILVQERKCVYIDEACVTEKRRGQGLFGALLAEAKQVARQWGMSRLELDVWSENTAAKRAFRQCGFQTYNEKMKLILDE